MRVVLPDEAIQRKEKTRCSEFLIGVLYDDAFHKRPDDATPRQDASSWCMACFSTRPLPDRIRQDA